MTVRSAPAELPDNVAAGDVVVMLAADAADGWRKITPRGRITTRNGPSYEFDPEALAARFDADNVKLAIDFDHGIARLASQGHTVNAIGWVEEMQARPDGLYGRVDWLDAGKAALAARSHRYFSPTFHHDDAGKATWLHSVSLVTSPALSNMPALADAGGNPPEHSMTKTIAAALGLQAEASEAACLSAIAGLKEGVVSKAVHDQTLVTLDAARQELDAIKAAGRKAQVDALIDGGLKTKKIVPAQKDHFVSLCATDDGLAQVTALLAATPAGLGDSGLDERRPDPGGDEAIDPVALAAEARQLVTAAAAAGNTLTIVDAVATVRAKRKGGSA